MSLTVERQLTGHFLFRKKSNENILQSNGVKSRVTLDKTTSLQVKVFSQNSTSLHANYLK